MEGLWRRGPWTVVVLGPATEWQPLSINPPFQIWLWVWYKPCTVVGDKRCPSVQVGFLINLVQARVISAERVTNEKMPSYDWPLGKPVGAFSSLVIEVGGPSPQPTVGGANPGQVVLNGMCKTEQTTGNE